MPKQPAFPGLRDAMRKKVTRREPFLPEMDAVVPWCRLLALIAPHYPKAGPKGGRPPMPLEVMLRVYFLQNWYALSDPMAEETLYDSEAMRRFAGIELGDDRIPAMLRAKVEHPFRIIKRQFGHVKTRYRGLARNRAQLFTLFALGNLFLVRRRLMA